VIGAQLLGHGIRQADGRGLGQIVKEIAAVGRRIAVGDFDDQAPAAVRRPDRSAPVSPILRQARLGPRVRGDRAGVGVSLLNRIFRLFIDRGIEETKGPGQLSPVLLGRQAHRHE
jgi:hypothetical protein